MNQDAWQKLFTALERAGLEYPSLHRAITALFNGRGCGPDSEALADVTLDRLARKVDEGEEVLNFVSYSKKIADLVHKEYYKEREKFRNATRELLYLSAEVQELHEEPDLRRNCQVSCVGRLSETELQLMVDYYLTGRDRDALAEELGLLIDTLRSRIHRLKNRLKKCVDDCRQTA